MDPTFATTDSRTGIEIADPIESARFALYAPDPVEPTPTDTDRFYFPVDAAVAVDTDALVVPKLVNVLVRTQDGGLLADNADHRDRSFGHGAYALELSTAPMKLYLTVESTVDVRHDDGSVTIAFDAGTEVAIGARSFHEQPAGTITTTDDPAGAMDAVSLLGSALKTTSPERSFPTLRGHPPLVEVGDEFDAPDGIERPDTGVRLELPTDYEYVYPAASLAYYLGAEVVPASEESEAPRLVTDDGFTYGLDGPRGYTRTVGQVLRQTFFLDCVTRTEGYYQVDLHEREAVEPLVDLDFAGLYDATLAERVAAYLSVPFETLEPAMPAWNLTTDVIAIPENVEVLPFVATDLALVRCPGDRTPASVTRTPEPIDEFFRDGVGSGAGEGAVTASTGSGDFTRSASGAADEVSAPDDIFNPEPVESLEHAWVGDGFPLGANKATVDSYRRRAERATPDQTSIDIHVVCNDDRMAEEGVVEEFYGLRDLLRFDVSVHYGVATDDLAGLFGSDADFLHYVGHVDDRGMRCPDGHLDARSLPSVDVTSFLLNACRSYEQGEALVDAGSDGGVVTLAEVANSVATQTGQTLARLLNCGFTLRVALSIVKDAHGTAYKYTTIGDGGLTLCQSASGIPVKLDVERLGDDAFDVSVFGYPVPGYEIGSMQHPHIVDNATRYLTSGCIDTFELTAAELDEFMNRETLPVLSAGTLYWSDEISAERL